MSQPLISVIVPIYNVAPYLRRCLDSLKNQTMKEIEIICIDDGSTDGSGEIVEEYKSDEWPVFRIIHTENKGLSAARNRGIDEARAEYLMFVDSDDWVEAEFCRIPYGVAMEKEADMVIFGSVIEKMGRTINCQCEKHRPSGLIGEFAAHEYGETVAWNKLYCKKMFNSISYPEGRVAEDVATTHKLVHIAKRIYLLSDRLYHYCFRVDSISHTLSLAIRVDGFVALKERYENLILYGYPEKKLIDDMCASSIGILARINSEDDENYIAAKKFIDSIYKIPRSMNTKQKIAFVAWKTNKKLFNILSRISGRNIKSRCC